MSIKVGITALLLTLEVYLFVQTFFVESANGYSFGHTVRYAENIHSVANETNATFMYTRIANIIKHRQEAFAGLTLGCKGEKPFHWNSIGNKHSTQ